MLNFDHLLIAATVISGLITLGYALFRYGADEERRKIVKVWFEIFTLCAVFLAVRLFYLFFPAVPPDAFFLGCTLIAGGLYGYYKIARAGGDEEQRKLIRFWRDAFLCLLAVFAFRGFFYDWFRIPSGSMLPTLTVGDLVLTDKGRYGYRLPLFNTKLTPGDAPHRGDIIVFKKPGEELFYIKRIVGLPGDVIRYGDDKQLSVNRAPVGFEVIDIDEERGRALARERQDDGWHDIYQDFGNNLMYRSPDADYCRINQSDIGSILTCDIPEGHYFVLGDNRDHSNDSRFWGVVPAQNIVGPATRVVFNHRLFTAFEMEQTDRIWRSLAPVKKAGDDDGGAGGGDNDEARE